MTHRPPSRARRGTASRGHVLGVLAAAALGLAATAFGLAPNLAAAQPAPAASPAEPPGARAAAPLSDRDRADLVRLEAYLNAITTLQARFVQVSSNGYVASGRLWMQRPGRMRFEYDPPSPILLVADGTFVIYHDRELGQTSHVPLGATPLGILLRERVQLSGDVGVERVQRGQGQLQVTLSRTSEPGSGTLTLMLTDNPLELRQWSVVDAQGVEVRVTLQGAERGARFDPALFRFAIIPGDEPRQRDRP